MAVLVLDRASSTAKLRGSGWGDPLTTEHENPTAVSGPGAGGDDRSPRRRSTVPRGKRPGQRGRLAARMLAASARPPAGGSDRDRAPAPRRVRRRKSTFLTDLPAAALGRCSPAAHARPGRPAAGARPARPRRVRPRLSSLTALSGRVPLSRGGRACTEPALGRASRSSQRCGSAQPCACRLAGEPKMPPAGFEPALQP